MTECVDSDVIITIGAALDWHIDDGLRHLHTCDLCRARIEALALTRAALTDTEPIDDAAVARITTALAAAATRERQRARTSVHGATTLEALLAAAAAPLVLVSSGIPIGSVAAGVLTGALGAALVIAARRVRLLET